MERQQEAGAWEEVAATLARRGPAAKEKIAALDGFLDAYPRSEQAAAARKARETLVAQLLRDDWQRTELSISDLAAGAYAARIAAWKGHLRRVADHVTAAHAERIEARIATVRRAWDDATYIRLKQWFQGDPQAAPRIAGDFAVYLRDFPDGRHRKAAKDFIAWWKDLQTERVYQVELLAVRLDKRKFRFDLRLDPYVVVACGKQAWKSPPGKGLAPTWQGTRFALRWKPGLPIRITIWDKDFRWDDKLSSIQLGGPLALARLRSRLRSSEGHAVQLRCTDLPWPELP